MFVGPARLVAPRLFAVAAFAAVVLLPRVVHAAEEEPTVVLTIQTLDAFENADSLTSALKRAVVDAPGWSLMKTDKDYALQVLTISLDCADPPDAACEQKIGDEIGANHFVWGRMHKEGSDVTGDLHLWTRNKGSTATTFRYSSNVKDAADDTLLAEARKHISELTGPPPGGTLKILAGAVTGPVLVDGKEAGRVIGGRVTLDVPPGPHRITVQIDGYNTMEAQIEMKPLEDKVLTLTPTRPEKGPDAQKILGFVTLGLGVAAGGVAIGATVKTALIGGDIRDLARTVKIEGKGAIDVCETSADGSYSHFGVNEANEIALAGDCDTGRTMQLLQMVFWPVAGALVGTSVILLSTSDWSSDSGLEAASIRLDPSFGPQGGDLKMTVRF